MKRRLWQATIYGQPAAQKAHGHRRGGHGGYDKSANDKKGIQATILAQGLRPKELLEGPLRVAISVYKARPKRLPRRVLIPTTRPDVDNYVKLIFDALNGFVWRDDNQVADLRVTKDYSTHPEFPDIGERPRVEIVIERIPEDVYLGSATDLLRADATHREWLDEAG